ncbi:hypothetical protein Tco_1165191 [Tanacetum coccineum]
MENTNPSSTLGSSSQEPSVTTHANFTARINKLLQMRQTIDSLLFKTMNELTNQSSDSEIFCPKEGIKELELRTQRKNNFEEELFKDRMIGHAIIVVGLSEVRLRTPFAHTSKLAYDESLGLIRCLLSLITGREAHLLEDKQIPSVGVFDEANSRGGCLREYARVVAGMDDEEFDSELLIYHGLMSPRMIKGKKEKATEVMKDKIPSKAVEHEMDDHMPDDIDGAKGEQVPNLVGKKVNLEFLVCKQVTNHGSDELVDKRRPLKRKMVYAE